MSTTFTESVVVPVANEADAQATADALEPFGFEDITVLHVVEKGEGVPDKTSLVQSEGVADRSFAAFRNSFPAADTKLIYRRDVVQGIIDAANEIDASAIVFRPRGGARIVQLLAGDRSLRLVTEATRPVIALTEDAEAEA